MVFDRANNTSVVITLTSNEALGVLDTARIEDYFGIDGQISLINNATQVITSVVMTYAANQFTGSKLLSLLPDGEYQVLGRVKDVHGNYTILGSFFDPIGNETINNLNFSIVDTGAGIDVNQIGADIPIYDLNVEPSVSEGPLSFDIQLTNLNVHPSVNGP